MPNFEEAFMPDMTGTLWDVGGGHLLGKQPELIFTLNQVGVKGENMYATMPVHVPVTTAGLWTAPLISTTDMQGECYYTLKVRWLQPGAPDGSGYSEYDFPDWQIQVPPSGGVIGDLNGAPTNQRIVYVSLTPPEEPRPFMMWLRMDPDNPSNPAGDGNLYEWRNA